MHKSMFGAAAGLVRLLGLSSCTNPYDPAQRALGGGLIGAGTGAAIGAAAGGGSGAALGAAIGGAAGAIGGVATTPPPPPSDTRRRPTTRRLRAITRRPRRHPLTIGDGLRQPASPRVIAILPCGSRRAVQPGGTRQVESYSSTMHGPGRGVRRSLRLNNSASSQPLLGPK